MHSVVCFVFSEFCVLFGATCLFLCISPSALFAHTFDMLGSPLPLPAAFDLEIAESLDILLFTCGEGDSVSRTLDEYELLMLCC